MQEGQGLMRLPRAWAVMLTRAQGGLCFPAERFPLQLRLLPSTADLVPTQVGHYSVAFPNHLGSRVFAREDSVSTEDTLESQCPG